MRAAVTLSVATAASLLALSANALELVKRSAPAVVAFDIERKQVPNPVTRDKNRRRKRQERIVTQELDNEETLYFLNLTLGTPPQRIRSHLDTGSSDLWVNTPSSEICADQRNVCDGGVYDPDRSSTHEFVSNDFNISYVDGSYAIGDYVTDTLGLGEVRLENFQFGVGLESTSPQGVLGIGYVTNEVQHVRNGGRPYPNLPQALVDAELIRSNAYSLWLNDLDSNRGQIMFGGVNAARYHGTLETVPVLSRRGMYFDLAIAMTGFSVTSGEEEQNLTTTDFPIRALLDTGASLTYLPAEVVSRIYDLVDGVYDPMMGIAYVPCNLRDTNLTFRFTFSSPSIAVDMTELVLDPLMNPDGTFPRFRDGSLACVFGITVTTGHMPILGDTFLRSAYVVYDLDNNEISLAQTRFNATHDEILEIGTGPNSVPDATGVPDPVTTADSTGTDGGRLGGPRPTGGIVDPTSTAGAPGPLQTALHLQLAAGLAGAGLIFGAM